MTRTAREGCSNLDNGTVPAEPPLSEAERSDSRAFLREILQALPAASATTERIDAEALVIT